jgi:hypothetical protein
MVTTDATSVNNVPLVTMVLRQGAWIARISPAIRIAIQLTKRWLGNLDCNPDC